VLCAVCYQRFLKSVPQPVGSLSLGELRAAAEKQHEPVAATPPVPALAAGTPAQPMSVLVKLQFKKFIAENSGMNAADVDAFLGTLPDDERRELEQAFFAQQAAPEARAPQPVAVVPDVDILPKPAEVRFVQENASQPKCPKCRSIRTTFNRQGFGVGKAAVGVLVTGGLGLLAVGIGFNNVVLTCFDCGHKWKR
jgi:hypothetical protein